MSRIPKRPHSGHVSSDIALNTVQEMANEEAEDPTAFSRPKRRSSLGFTLAKIDTPSNIPLPPSVGPKAPNINLAHINKLIGYNQTLNRQKQAVSGRSYITESDALVDNEIQYQIEALEDLDKTIGRLLAKSENLEIDIVELKRSNKKLSHKISDIKNQIASDTRKFDYVEDAVMKNVLNKEKLVNIQLEELSSKLSAQLNDIKFQLHNEVETAKQYQETDNNEIEELTAQKERLQKELAEEKAKVQAKVKEQAAILEKELMKKLDDKMQKSNELMKIYEANQTLLEEALKDFENLNDQVKLLKSDIATVEQSIRDIEASSAGFGPTKAKLLQHLAELETTFSDLNKENISVESQLGVVNEKYESTRSKIKKQTRFRQLLENSIMEYQGKKRIIVNHDNTLEEDDNRINCNGAFVSFSKCLADLPPTDLIEEFSFFAYASLQSKDSNLIFTGHQVEHLLVDSIFQIYSTLKEKSEPFHKKGLRFATSLKGLEIHDTFYDIIDSKRNLGCTFTKIADVTSQTMLIDEVNDLNVIKTIDTPVPRVYIMRIDCTNDNTQERRSNFVSFLDLTSLNATEQESVLETVNAGKPTSLLQQVLFRLRAERCLFLCQASQANKGILPILAQLYNS